MNESNNFWLPKKTAWCKIPYSDDEKRFFWTKDYGLFDINIIPYTLNNKTKYRVEACGYDGSLNRCFKDHAFYDTISEAKAGGEIIAEDIICDLGSLI